MNDVDKDVVCASKTAGTRQDLFYYITMVTYYKGERSPFLFKSIL